MLKQAIANRQFYPIVGVAITFLLSLPLELTQFLLQTFQMARLDLQARLARPHVVHVCLLYFESYLPTGSQPRPEKDLRGDGQILRRALEPDPTVLRPGFLRFNRDDSMVEPVYGELTPFHFG